MDIFEIEYKYNVSMRIGVLMVARNLLLAPGTVFSPSAVPCRSRTAMFLERS